MIKIAVLDYGLGNTKSICSALEKSDSTIFLTNSKDVISECNGLILPGVGAFAHGMRMLKEKNLISLIYEFASTGKPLLGICLGMQMLFEKSSEFGSTNGLGLIPGQVKKLKKISNKNIKLPNVGWNSIYLNDISQWDKTILNKINNSEDMYFVHSYYADPKNNEDILSVSSYAGFEYCSTVNHKNIYGCQYHPEKSGAVGIKIINNFVKICERKKNV